MSGLKQALDVATTFARASNALGGLVTELTARHDLCGGTMREGYGDIWESAAGDMAVDAVVITTNGFVKANGACVMGRGIAVQARDRFPGLDKRLGQHIQIFGNSVGVFEVEAPYVLMTMPVKPVVGERGEPGWKAKADLNLIADSALWLQQLADIWEMKGDILMPRPGCGNGGLRWEDVKPVVAFLDDRFVAMHMEGIR